MYDNVNDASRYLGNTICYWDGEPFYVDGVVSDVTPEGRLYFKAIGRSIPWGPRGDNDITCDIADARFNAFKYTLGYYNSKNGRADFVTRRPSRIQSQGITASNLSVNRNGQVRQANRDDLRSWLSDKGFRDMLRGEYPTIEEVRAKMQEDKTIKSMAFDRFMALRRHENFTNLFYLAYKGEDVSWSDDGAFVLPNEFTYLTESCQPKGCLKAA